MSPKSISENTLFYGDNLFILRKHKAINIVDFINLDPPFNSTNYRYSILGGEVCQFQISRVSCSLC